MNQNKVLQPFAAKDIIFLAIISAVATCTAAVMAVVAHTYIFGLAQLVTALQFSLFPAVALMKVRKVGCVLFFTVFTGIVELFMAPVMFFSSVITGLVLEALIVLLFRGYQSDKAVFVAAWLIIPMTLPLNLVYYLCFFKELMQLFFSSGLGVMSVVCVIAAIAGAAIGAGLGIKISKELQRAGVLKR